MAAALPPRRPSRSVRPSGADEQVPTSSEGSRAERQLVAWTGRYGEVVASMRELGRPEAGQHVAVTAVGRAFSRSRSRSSARRRSVSRSSDSSS
jgi:hypothetical protein